MIPYVFLAVSSLAFGVQVISAITIFQQHKSARHGVLRTVICRVIVAVVYVALGIEAVVATPVAASISLLVFACTQMLWLGSSVLDVRLARGRSDTPSVANPE